MVAANTVFNTEFVLKRSRDRYAAPIFQKFYKIHKFIEFLWDTQPELLAVIAREYTLQRTVFEDKATDCTVLQTDKATNCTVHQTDSFTCTSFEARNPIIGVAAVTIKLSEEQKSDIAEGWTEEGYVLRQLQESRPEGAPRTGFPRRILNEHQKWLIDLRDKDEFLERVTKFNNQRIKERWTTLHPTQVANSEFLKVLHNIQDVENPMPTFGAPLLGSEIYQAIRKFGNLEQITKESTDPIIKEIIEGSYLQAIEALTHMVKQTQNRHRDLLVILCRLHTNCGSETRQLLMLHQECLKKHGPDCNLVDRHKAVYELKFQNLHERVQQLEQTSINLMQNQIVELNTRIEQQNYSKPVCGGGARPKEKINTFPLAKDIHVSVGADNISSDTSDIDPEDTVIIGVDPDEDDFLEEEITSRTTEEATISEKKNFKIEISNDLIADNRIQLTDTTVLESEIGSCQSEGGADNPEGQVFVDRNLEQNIQDEWDPLQRIAPNIPFVRPDEDWGDNTNGRDRPLRELEDWDRDLEEERIAAINRYVPDIVPESLDSFESIETYPGNGYNEEGDAYSPHPYIGRDSTNSGYFERDRPASSHQISLPSRRFPYGKNTRSVASRQKRYVKYQLKKQSRLNSVVL